MANNNNLFNAALAGASSGVSSRWLSNPSSASYDSQSTLIEAFATAFDAAIAPIAGGGSRGQAETVQAICSAFWRDRIITSQTDLTDAVTVLVALYNSLAPRILADTGGSSSLDGLPNVYWVQQDAAGSGGTAAILDGSTPFATIASAAAAFEVGFNGQMIVLFGDYSNANEPVDASGLANNVSITGVGGSILLDSTQVILPPLHSTRGVLLFLDNVSIVGDAIDGIALNGWANVAARETAFYGHFSIPTSLCAFVECIFGGNVVVNDSSRFIGCRTVNPGMQFTAVDCFVDYASFISFGQNGVVRVDGANNAVWFLTGSNDSFSNVAYAALQDANRSIVYAETAIEGGIWCSQGSLTASRVVTVDVTGAPDLGLFRVYNFPQNGGETVTVNGVVCEDNMCTILQIQGGVLVLFATELL